MQSKMMAYDRVIAELNSARLRGTSSPIVHSLISASAAVASDVRPLFCLLPHAEIYLVKIYPNDAKFPRTGQDHS